MSKNIEAENVRWDLSELYSDIDDPQIDTDVARLVQLKKDFQLAYKGKLSEQLAGAITDFSELSMLENKLETYLYLKQSLDVTAATTKAKLAETDRILSQAQGEYMTFFLLELVALEDATLEKLYATDPVVAKHRPWIEQVRIFKPYFLSEPVESALTKRAPFAVGAWNEFFDELSADLEFEYKTEKKTLTEMLHLLAESKDATERAASLGLINVGLKERLAKYSAQNLYMVTGLGAVEDKERTYANPMTARNLSNKVSDMVVGALHKAVMEVGGSLARRYYKLKAAHLGLKTLRWSDRNAPMPFSDDTLVPFPEAMATTLAAYESFSPTLAGLIQTMVDKKRIDAPAGKGRRGGAYNYSGVFPGGEPRSFTFLNYLGSNRDVMTLAHELGHGVHGMLAGREQGVLMSHAPIAYCETASVFGETVTFNFLKQRLIDKNDKQSLLALIMGKIDDVINTAIRQVGLSNFERRIHGMDASYKEWQEPKKLSVEEMNQIWLATLKELYGAEGEVFTYENAEYLWSFIPHFHRSFYVYGYAFGELLTKSIYTKRGELGDKFEPLYLEMLKSGSTKNVEELLQPFGLNPSDEKFWSDGLEIGLGAMIKEAEELSRELGVVILSN